MKAGHALVPAALLSFYEEQAAIQVDKVGDRSGDVENRSGNRENQSRNRENQSRNTGID
ncbi:hypothetical protein [Salibacterium lacus]|uniref:Uncharacterized protein n=1 Tax=Salibacterium lacus TaxID=1898109 RepID=A0ABW5T6X3_9BACI